MLAAIRIRRGMDVATFQSHVIYSAAQTKRVVCQELCKSSGGLAVVAGTAIFLKWRLRTTA